MVRYVFKFKNEKKKFYWSSVQIFLKTNRLPILLWLLCQCVVNNQKFSVLFLFVRSCVEIALHFIFMWHGQQSANKNSFFFVFLFVRNSR